MTADEPTRLIVTSSRSLDEVIPELQAAGFRVDRTLTSLGVVTGSSAASGIPALRRIRGVTIEGEETVSVPPPDAPTQ